jgi:hypothetical protein
MTYAPSVPKSKVPATGKRKTPRQPNIRAYELTVPLHDAWDPPGVRLGSLLPRGIMAKLEVGTVDDPLEREADAVADAVMRMPAPSREAKPEGADADLDAEASGEELGEVPEVDGSPFVARRQCASCEAEEDDGPIRRSIAHELVMRACETCDDDDEIRRASSDPGATKPIGRESAAGRRGGVASSGFAEQLRGGVQAGGRPLSNYARNFLEPRIGADLGAVRLHDDPRAQTLAQRINARAFTIGHDIFFGSGELSPTSHGGMRLLAHEVAHTLQSSNHPKLERSLRRTPDVIRRSCSNLQPEELASASPGKVRALKIADLLELYVFARSDDEDTCMLAYRALAGYYGVSVAEIDAAMKVAYPADKAEFPTYTRPAGVKAGHETGFKITLSNQFRLEDQGLVPKIIPVDLGAGDAKKKAKANAAATKIRDLPESVKDFLFTEGAVAKLEINLQNYADLEAVAEMALRLSPEERAEFLARARARGETAESWYGFRVSLEKFVEEQQTRVVNLFEMTTVRERLSKLSAPAVDAFIKAKFRWSDKGLSAADEAAEAELAALADGFQSTTEVYTLVEQLTGAVEVEAAQVGLAHLARYQLGLREAEAKYADSGNVADLHQQVQTAHSDPETNARFEEKFEAENPKKIELLRGHRADPDQMRANKKRFEKAQFLERETIGAVQSDHPIVAERGFDLRAITSPSTEADDVGQHVTGFITDRHGDVEHVRKVLQDPAKRRGVFGMNELMTATFESLAMAPGDSARRLVEEFIAEEQFRNSINAVITALGEIAVGIMAAAIGGPIAAGVALATGVKGIHDTAQAFEDYQLGTAAHGAGLSSSAPSVGWVVLTAVAAGVDLGAGAKVLSVLKAFDTGAIGSVDELSSALKSQGVKGKQLDELVDKADARQAAKTDEALDTAAESAEKIPVKINFESHEVFSWIDPQTGRFVLGMCSDECGDLIRKIQQNIDAKPADAVEVREILTRYKKLAEDIRKKVPKELKPRQADEAAADLVQELNDELAAKGYPGAFDPSIDEAMVLVDEAAPARAAAASEALEPVPVIHPVRPSDLSGGKHAADRPIEDVISEAGKEVRGRRIPQGRWSSANAAQAAANRVDPSLGRQVVELRPGEGTVIHGKVKRYPPDPKEPEEGTWMEVDAPRALALPRTDGTIHIFPIDETHYLYDGPIGARPRNNADLDHPDHD